MACGMLLAVQNARGTPRTTDRRAARRSVRACGCNECSCNCNVALLHAHLRARRGPCRSNPWHAVQRIGGSARTRTAVGLQLLQHATDNMTTDNMTTDNMTTCVM